MSDELTPHAQDGPFHASSMTAAANPGNRTDSRLGAMAKIRVGLRFGALAGAPERCQAMKGSSPLATSSCANCSRRTFRC